MINPRTNLQLLDRQFLISLFVNDRSRFDVYLVVEVQRLVLPGVRKPKVLALSRSFSIGEIKWIKAQLLQKVAVNYMLISRTNLISNLVRQSLMTKIMNKDKNGKFYCSMYLSTNILKPTNQKKIHISLIARNFEIRPAWNVVLLTSRRCVSDLSWLSDCSATLIHIGFRSRI